MSKIIESIITFFAMLFFLNVYLIPWMNIVRGKWVKVISYVSIVSLYFIVFYSGQSALISSYIEGTSTIGVNKKVKKLNRCDLQYNVRIELKDKYKKMYNAKEATYNFSQNEIKGFKLQKKIKKGSEIKQISENRNSYKQFKKDIKGLRTCLNLFDALFIVCIAFFLVFGPPRGWDSTIILIIKLLSIIITFIYFINSDLKNFLVIYELVLFYTISEFLFDIKKRICFRIIPGYLKANSKYIKKSIPEELLLSELKRENNINED